jgi:hypothetical protein
MAYSVRTVKSIRFDRDDLGWLVGDLDTPAHIAFQGRRGM